MAASKSTEFSAAEQELKRRGRRRLIGAATLALLAIVFLPMIFDPEPKPGAQGQQEISIQLPDKEKAAPLPAPSLPATALPNAQPAVAPQLAGESSAPEGAAPAAKSEPIKPAPASKPAVKPPPAPAAAKSGFVVQIGAYRDADNARQVVAKLKELKLPVTTDVLAITGGKVTRIRVGPYPDKAGADGALAELKLSGLDGKIVPLKP